ncbi:hypothetical protein [Acinetobacter phage vB_AbaS_TCUP2199]|nr:hypothetical protein [Acinetobacter phage vB_AbaS_TCUP2199]
MGGKKKQPPSPTIAADNLYSQDIVELAFGMCEGTIFGLKDGLKSFYINNLPLVAETGEYNFQDVAVNIRQGYMDDQPIRYFSGGESSIIAGSLGLSLPADVARTIVTPAQYRGAIKSLDVRIIINQLTAGDGQNSYESSVIFQVKYRRVGDTNWRYVNETTETLIQYKRKVATLRQAAKDRGLDFDAMTPAQQYDFELNTLKELKNIVSADLGNLDTPAETEIQYQNGGYGRLIRRAYSVDLYEKYLSQLPTGTTTSQIQNEMIVVTGKTTAGYIYELNIPIFDDSDANHDWEVQIVRRSKELTSDEKKFSSKTISLDSVTIITDTEKAYPKTAICHVVAQHTDRFDDVPDFTAEIMGLMCDIPVNYNPITKTWAGIWDGRFKKGWTDNNALIAREIIMNRDWGKRASEPQLRVDNTSLMEAIKYCDEKVPDLNGEMKPRHTFNEAITAERDIDEYLKYVLGSFHATSREMFGVYRFFIDKPKTPRFFVSSETVFQTGLSYYRSDLSSRYNFMRVIFANAANDYQEDRRVLLDEESQAVNGIIPYAFQCVGATNLSEAIRQAVYLMYTNKEETTFITFTQPRLGHVVDLYDNFYIFDKEMDWGLGTRISSYDPATQLVTLRDALVEMSSSEVYTMYFHTQDTVMTAFVKSINPHQLLVTEVEKLDDVNLYLNSIENAPIGLAGGVYGQPKIFRVLSIEQTDSSDVAQGEMFLFKGAIVAPIKYQAIDNINDPSLVNFKYNSLDLTYKRDRIPSMPFDVRLWLRDLSNALGQPTYGITFNTIDPAHKYKITWVNKETGEARETILFDTEGVLAPAFPETTSLKLKITPYNKAGQAGEPLIMDNVQLGKAQENGLPKFISAEYYAPTKSIRFAFTQANFQPYTGLIYNEAYVNYSAPYRSSANQPVPVDSTYYDIPYVGAGTYKMSLRYEATSAANGGFVDTQKTDTWTYYGDDSGSLPVAKYPKPVILGIESYTRAKQSWNIRTAPEGMVFVHLVVQIPNYSQYPIFEQYFREQYAWSPFFAVISDHNDGDYRIYGYLDLPIKAASTPANSGIFDLYFEVDNSMGGILFAPDETFVGAKIKIRVSDKNGVIGDPPDWEYNALDSEWAEVIVPAVSTNGFNPTAVYNSSSS